MKKFKVGVIGAGAIAQALHIPGYVAAKNCELTAIADPLERCLEQVKQRGWNFARTYSNYREMLAKENLDVVSICTPNAFHKEMAIACIEKGVITLLEKPIAISMKEAWEIDRAAKKHRARVMVGFSHRFNEHCQRVKQAVDKGEIGKPYMIRIRFAHNGPWPGWARSDWFYNPKLAGGGALLDMGIHALDLAQWFLGPVTAVQAKVATLRKKIKVDDNAVCLLEFGKKCLGYIEVGWSSPSGFVGVELMGDNGSIVVDYAADKSTMTTGVVKPSGERQQTTKVLLEKSKIGSWTGEMIYFTSLLNSKKSFTPGLKDGILALKAAMAAQESSKTGRRIVLK